MSNIIEFKNFLDRHILSVGDDDLYPPTPDSRLLRVKRLSQWMVLQPTPSSPSL